MEQLTGQIIGALSSLFASDTISEADKGHLGLIDKEVTALSGEQRQALASQLLAVDWPRDNFAALMVFLFDQLKDFRFLHRLCDEMPAHLSPQSFYEYYWNLVFRMFGAQGPSGEVSEALRARFTPCAAALKAFLKQRGLQHKRSISRISTVAIVSPQLLNMRHSPTREAYSLACHLQHYCQVNAVVINTNGMNYGNDHLKLVQQAQLFQNEALEGLQQIKVDYLNFVQHSVNVLSFTAGPMTSMKIAQILDALGQLKVDAVIAHGENLLVQEAIHGVYPSLFATTGSVVPFAHCDGYFIPANLFNAGQQQVADQYGHSNFLMESMLVTPEGKADTPADKASLGIADDAFVYLVVGTRLVKELTREFIDTCARLLSDDTSSTLVFAGTDALDLSQWFCDDWVAQERVINLGFRQDLAALSLMSDVYLNPDRNGGGTSSQTAILNGTPVVTLDKGHISAVVPETRRLPDWQSYLEYALRLQQQPAFLATEVALFEQHFADNLDTRRQVETMHRELCRIAAEAYP